MKLFLYGGKNSKTDSGPIIYTSGNQGGKEKRCGTSCNRSARRGNGRDGRLLDSNCAGSDGALAIAMLKLIVEEEWYDKEFVENYTRGFGEFSVYLKKCHSRRNVRILRSFC